MARSERTQWARLDIDGVTLLADLAAGLSLARVLDFHGPQLRCFGATAASSVPLEVDAFNGRVIRGASCNCSVLTLTPHANGTHTESVGHLTVERVDVQGLIPQRLLLAVLLTVEPELAADSIEGTLPRAQDADRLITRAGLEQAWPASPSPRLTARAAVVRTQPNGRQKFTEQSSGAAPFLSAEAVTALVERGVEHLVLDVPSADRASDGGALTAHRIFFGLPAGSTQLAQAQRPDCTITELAYIADAIPDGWYLLALHAPAIAGEAVPSRPMLYPLRAA
ncbi:MAG TPA: cyclase family protein [Steroidobacteraceae bacterium]|jgi:kynurenine formamidase